MKALVPSNHRPLEHALAEVLGPINAIDPRSIETLWDAWRCPASYLPFLAYALSVDFWDDGWSEIQKRKTIAYSAAYHRRKGTRLAVELALESGNRPFSFVEWFEQYPLGRRGTARAFIEAPLPDVARALSEVRPRVMAAKPKSRAVFLGVGEQTSGIAHLAGAVSIETLTTISPYAFSAENPEVAFITTFGMHIDMLTTIEAAP